MKTQHIIDRNGEQYLSRYTLAKFRGWSLYLHVFHNGDADREMHDHPASFLAVILRGGYIEERNYCKRFFRPGSILLRRATDAHRIELRDGRKAVSLVLFATEWRQWGFFTRKGWIQWEQFLAER